MATQHIDVLIVGAGVSGLTTAVRLAERGYRVQIRAERRPQLTTSCAAGALWGPVGASHGRMAEWSHETLLKLIGIAGDPDAGVRLVHGLEASYTGMSRPSWLEGLPDLSESAAGDLPPGYLSGWRYTAPIVDMPVYLRYLERLLDAAGIGIETVRVTSLHEAAREAPVVVNCTGSGARELVPDVEVVPERGQLVVVENPGVDEFFCDAEHAPEMTYFLPHGDRMVLGSTAHPARDDADYDPALAERIVRRCATIRPELRRARVLGHRVGFRPTRTHIRVEREALGGRHLIHNYGHGGGGVSLSWGCAGAVADLVDELALR
ncbi:MAG TPA: FAD-dependent oxidoreductase [Rugosimonospora sp.]|nr:FAD-dependent oxidoreductase [Rugosimonospora sp.]